MVRCVSVCVCVCVCVCVSVMVYVCAEIVKGLAAGGNGIAVVELVRSGASSTRRLPLTSTAMRIGLAAAIIVVLFFTVTHPHFTNKAEVRRMYGLVVAGQHDMC
jgi:hypothetical protein